ncbi:flagellar hook-basal body complex protein [Temperatibacter marinus]|uniref:Flagellar hook protein FlgE n=1 Tax=Temperatibacter marinus TaxID=1456591 RepID=A0AA52HAH1_9PROT|nr:flagellar hook-basal body complex protein [Temperatibacter marinus]WND02735.1 flagellar hook-basal body complex protein [Temperatibacter marinus]
MAFTSLAAGVSGLQSFSEAVGVIADNITNVNTVGYKESRSRFSTLVTETAAIASYSPGGVKSTTETLVSKQGLLQPSGSSTDLSVDGNGFFPVRQEANNTSEVIFTRAGSFTQDQSGFLKNTAGLYLMGWELDSDGLPPVNSSQQTALEPINFISQTGEAEATAGISLRANFSANSDVNTDYAAEVAGDGYTAGEIADGTIAIAGDDFEEDIDVVDAQGNTVTLRLAAVKSGVNEWTYEIYAPDAFADTLDSAVHGTDGLVAYGILEFNGDGTLDLANSEFTAESAASGLTYPVDLSSTPDLTLEFDNGAAGTYGSEDVTIGFDFGNGSDSSGINQKGAITSLLSKTVDGAAFGDVVGVQIASNGDVTTLFDSGLSLTRYRIPISTFNNADGLIRRQGNAYGRSDISGEPSFKEAGSAGAGKVSSNTLELSTVDLANEFAELIKVQRAFSSSTRIISTSDEILEELTRL